MREATGATLEHFSLGSLGENLAELERQLAGF